MDELIRLFSRLGPSAIVLVVLAVIVLPQSIRILREYERGVIFRLGKLQGAKGPLNPAKPSKSSASRD